GMFAFALWDRKEHQLHLVRDRLGEKPMYYGWMGETFLFGSELKALRAHPAWHGAIDRVALDALLRFDFIPAPLSIYTNIKKLLPGSVLTLSDGQREPCIDTYWTPKRIFEQGNASPRHESEDEAACRLDELLGDAVQGQLASDVPLGAFLSGGIDSTMITALMCARSDQSVRTFTIGFTDAFNEAVHARAVAHYLGTEHTELYITPEDALRVIPKLPSIYDEPFADPSQIPTFLVCALASQHVKVALSGDGGDELFGGYSYYASCSRTFDRLSAVPLPVRRTAAAALSAFGSPNIWSAFDAMAPVMPKRMARLGVRHGMGTLARRLAAPHALDMYPLAYSRWNEEPSLVTGLRAGLPARTARELCAELTTTEEQLMYSDLIGYLPDDILVKVDRASMAVSLETRAPFLDHRIVEFVGTLPLELRLRGERTKWLLRRVLRRYVPDYLVERPKHGFGVPIALWLRQPLRAWGESLLDERAIEQDGYLRAPVVRRMWREHLEGSSYWTGILWSILMFQAWREQEAN
ncbi:MAG TPA: asparagine synthase (glutamine-hydrolyzing), partial [Gemmatimonadaceae bacterium]